MKLQFSIFFLLIVCYPKIYSQPSYSPITIQTPASSNVTANKLTSADMDDQTKADLNVQFKSLYPGIVKIEDASYSYNCHGYAWYLTEHGQPLQIYTPQDDIFWSDGSYINSNPSEAEKVSYGSASDHSAVTTATLGFYISKWGNGPAYYHSATNCPYAATDLHFYKRTCTQLNLSGTYSTSETYWNCIINVSGVIINNNSNIILNATNEITISSNFTVNVGSTLELY